MWKKKSALEYIGIQWAQKGKATQEKTQKINYLSLSLNKILIN